MLLDVARTRKYLKEFNYCNLFIEELGWDRYTATFDVKVDGKTFTLTAIAQKRGLAAFTCSPLNSGSIPDYTLRRKIERQTAKSVHEHLIIYQDGGRTTQIWQWVKHEPGKPTACREHTFQRNQSGDALIQKLQNLVFSLDEEETLTIVEVAGRTRAAFDVERITKRFYDRFKDEHTAFFKFLEGIPDEEMERWYVSVMLNRLMFIYFIQKKGFLDSDTNYLRNKLALSKERGKDRFYKNFLCHLFFEGFAKKEDERSTATNTLLGKVPYLNGGLFLRHQIEELYGKSIQISDKAFEKLFDFFDQYQWHLDERPLRNDKEINPDVLGYIFEKYINQKQMGAYYTKEDITEYISKNTVIPFLFDAAKKKCKIAFEGEQSVWRLLQTDPDRYIYNAVKKGIDLPLPEEIALGIKNVSKRTEWNKSAPSEYALPTEIWREVVARRQRYDGIRAKILNGEIQSINDFITYNLNIRQFAQDVIENSEGPELLRAFYHAIEKVTVLDPTCGSGAFLFAALNILEPLYEACLNRMEVFLNELERSGEKHRSDKYSDFNRILKRIEEHPNLKYFIYKSIIINNLYGVDIMEEAIEICKLRLFLKLVAQVESDEHIEPLPDIDFNIRAGNTLVGYTSLADIKRAMEGDMIKLLSLPTIEEKAEIADRAFKKFHEMQTEQDMDANDFTEAKSELKNRLNVLEDELNKHLAGEYGIDSKKKTVYEKWLNSHQPFHWFIEFYGILKSGGFDVIIGNPPYVEYSKVKNEYTIHGYETENCGNLYTLIIERCIIMKGRRGKIGQIIPLPSINTQRMVEFQKLLRRCNEDIWVSSYDERPNNLFTGVDQRLSILIFGGDIHQNLSNIYTTGINRWAKIERDCLFKKIRYIELSVPKNYQILSILKSSDKIESSILNKFVKHVPISKLLAVNSDPDNQIIAYRTAGGRYWKVFLNKPFETKSLSNKITYLQSMVNPKVLVAALSSDIFWWYYSLHFDMYNLKDYMIFGFRFNYDNELLLSELIRLGGKLIRNLNDTAEESLIESCTRGEVRSKLYVVSKSKSIIDEIDRVLAKHYGFTDEELDFIINYDIKYRMGRDVEEGSEE